MRQSGVLLLVLVALVGVGGAYNYHRNAHLDAELADRAYATLSDADLAALLAAYRESAGQRGGADLREVDPTRQLDGYAAADFVGKVQAFERFQEEHAQLKDSYRARLSVEVVIEALEQEQELRRRGLDQPHARILRRILGETLYGMWLG